MQGPFAPAAPLLAAVLSGALALSSAVARAAPPSGSDKAAAESLDAEGKKLLNQRRYDEACAKFDESYRLSPGNGVLLRFGLCQELQGKTVGAWLTFRDAAARARASGDAAVESLATKRAAALEPRLSRLTVRLGEGADGVDQVRVTRDGVSLGPASLGSPLPVDPGLPVVEASAPGGRTFAQRVVVGEGGASETVTVTFAAPPTREAAALAASSAARSPRPTSPPDAGHERGGWSTQTTLALVAGGLGLAGLGTGAAFQLRAVAKRNEAYDRCGGRTNDCPDDALDARDDAKAALRVATPAFAVGAVGALGGLVLWLTAPSKSPARANAPHLSTVVAAGHVEMRLQGAW